MKKFEFTTAEKLADMKRYIRQKAKKLSRKEFKTFYESLEKLFNAYVSYIDISKEYGKQEEKKTAKNAVYACWHTVHCQIGKVNGFSFYVEREEESEDTYLFNIGLKYVEKEYSLIHNSELSDTIASIKALRKQASEERKQAKPNENKINALSVDIEKLLEKKNALLSIADNATTEKMQNSVKNFSNAIQYDIGVFVAIQASKTPEQIKAERQAQLLLKQKGDC